MRVSVALRLPIARAPPTGRVVAIVVKWTPKDAEAAAEMTAMESVTTHAVPAATKTARMTTAPVSATATD
jgi:hypothetical protein